MTDTIYQGDVGLEILLDCGRDIAGAFEPAILARTPSGAVRTFPGALKVVDGVTRCISYVTQTGDLAEAGVYRLQAFLRLGDWSGTGRTARLLVRPRFS